MSENNLHSSIITLRLNREDNGTFKIDERETMHRTKKMVAVHRKIKDVRTISVRDDLASDLLYTPEQKKDLKVFIENFFFADVGAVSNENELVQATTVGDLTAKIFDSFIPNGNRI